MSRPEVKGREWPTLSTGLQAITSTSSDLAESPNFNENLPTTPSCSPEAMESSVEELERAHEELVWADEHRRFPGSPSG